MRDLLVVGGIADGVIEARRFVSISTTSGRDFAAAADNGAVVGVSMAAAKDGAQVEVAMIGTVVVEADAAIAPGALVGSAAGGKAKTAPTGERHGGVLIEAVAAAAGDRVEILLAVGKA